MSLTFGLLSAAGFGVADLIARFTSRQLGAAIAFFLVLLISLAGAAAALAAAGALAWPTAGPLAPLVAYGVLVTVVSVLFYQALAIGPVSVVAPIVGAYPAFVALYFGLAGRPIAPGVWVLILLTLAGVGLVGGAGAKGDTRRARPLVIGLALGAAIAYVGVVVLGEAAARVFGDVQTLFWGRAVALATLAPGLVVLRLAGSAGLGRVDPIGRWIWLLIPAQAGLDFAGYILLLLGSLRPGPELAAVASSTFGLVTTLLAWLVLKERILRAQWLGIGLVFLGVGGLVAAT